LKNSSFGRATNRIAYEAICGSFKEIACPDELYTRL